MEYKQSCGHQADQTTGSEACDHQAGGGAALQGRGDADAGEECEAAVAQSGIEKAAEAGTEGALHPGLHHADAPEQESHRTGEVKQGGS